MMTHTVQAHFGHVVETVVRRPPLEVDTIYIPRIYTKTYQNIESNTESF